MGGVVVSTPWRFPLVPVLGMGEWMCGCGFGKGMGRMGVWAYGGIEAIEGSEWSG